MGHSARGDGNNLVFACQNLGQIDTKWEEEKAETIVAAPRVRMFGPGIQDTQTLDYVSKLTDETAVETTSMSRSNWALGNNDQQNVSSTKQSLIPPSLMREIDPFTAVVFSGNIPPFQVRWRSAHMILCSGKTGATSTAA